MALAPTDQILTILDHSQLSLFEIFQRWRSQNIDDENVALKCVCLHLRQIQKKKTFPFVVSLGFDRL